jgi:hypothetical protein
MIFNKKNKKMLIGTAYDFDEHRKNMIYLLRKGQHTNKELQKDFDRGNKMVYKVLYAEQHSGHYSADIWRPMIRKAQEFILKYDAINKGYNQPKGIGAPIAKIQQEGLNVKRPQELQLLRPGENG